MDVSDKIVPLHGKPVADNPIRQQMLDHVAQVLDSCEITPTAICFMVLCGDFERHKLRFMFHDSMKYANVLTYTHAVVMKEVMDHVESG